MLISRAKVQTSAATDHIRCMKIHNLLRSAKLHSLWTWMPGPAPKAHNASDAPVELQHGYLSAEIPAVTKTNTHFSHKSELEVVTFHSPLARICTSERESYLLLILFCNNLQWSAQSQMVICSAIHHGKRVSPFREITWLVSLMRSASQFLLVII